MKRTLWVTASAIALMVGMNAASAQMGGQPGSGGDQPRMQNSPSGSTKGEEKVKPGVHEKEPGAAVQRDQKDKSKMTQQGQGVQDKGAQEKMGQQGGREKMGRDEKSEKTDRKMGRDEKSGQEQKATQTQQQGTQKTQVQGQDQKPATQQGAQQGTSGSAKSVQLSSEQRTKIQATIKSQKVERVTNVNFTIRVGARVPHTVRYYPLPIEIVEIVPEYRGFYFVLVGDEILIIDPNTFEIVAILPA
jgi:uncharacterized protein DUF1236